jgi:hypothetical protein
MPLLFVMDGGKSEKQPNKQSFLTINQSILQTKTQKV